MGERHDGEDIVDRVTRSSPPATRRRTPTYVRPLAGLATVVAIVGIVVAATGAAIPAAGAEEPALHHVTYTVTSQQPFYAEIYYRDTDPPTFADYSHNPYQYSPTAEADVGPGKSWVLDVMLADPDQWAMVVATSGLSRKTPMFHCELAVDGNVVVTNDGPKGALCSIRHW